MKWRCVAGASLVGALLLTSAMEGNAQAMQPDAYRDALVRVNCGDGCWGTGFFVKENPPIVATCYHVVKDRAKVTVSARGFATPFDVEAILPHADQDIAFIKVKNAGPWEVTIPWSKRAKVNESLGGALQFFGLKYFDGLNKLLLGGASFLRWEPLAKLGGPTNLRVPISFEILSFEENPRKPLPGDSGGPMFNAQGELVGMVAGSARQSKSDTWTHFGVGLTADVPAPNDPGWTTDRLTENDPYYLAEITRHVTKLVQEKNPLSDDLEAAGAANQANEMCLKNVNQMLGAYQGHWDELPPKGSAEFVQMVKALELKLNDDCEARYEQSRPDLASYEEAAITRDDAGLVKAATNTRTVDGNLADVTAQLNKHTAKEESTSTPDISDVLHDLKTTRGKAPELDAVEARLKESHEQTSIPTLKLTQQRLEQERAKLEASWKKADIVEKEATARADAAAKRALAILKGPTPSTPSP